MKSVNGEQEISLWIEFNSKLYQVNNISISSFSNETYTLSIDLKQFSTISTSS